MRVVRGSLLSVARGHVVSVARGYHRAVSVHRSSGSFLRQPGPEVSVPSGYDVTLVQFQTERHDVTDDVWLNVAVVMTAGAVSAPLIIPIMHLEKHTTKNLIDTGTRVCIQSDTPGVLLLYTLDGSRPGGAAGSRKYSQPILLHAGRVVVRATAVTSDGRQSAVVTKVFSVAPAAPDRKQSNQQPEGSAAPGPMPPEQSMMGKDRPQSGPRFLSSGPGSPSTAAQTGPQSEGSGVITQTSAGSPQTNFLRCPGCLGCRPSDPLARFCPQCGAALPLTLEHSPPPAGRLQVNPGRVLCGVPVACCGFCSAPVPVSSRTCLVCESSGPAPQGHLLCACCGSGNPAQVSTCLTCEARLLQVTTPTSGGHMVSVAKQAGSAAPPCPRCGRLNRPDARYCDGCGSKAWHAAGGGTCWRCGASGQPTACYCVACGVFLESQAPPTANDDITGRVERLSTNQATPTAERSTQTVGLYFPSAPELQRRDHQWAGPVSKQPSRDRQMLTTAISPGRGYWRTQLDHVCAHLRSYAQNHAPFRTLLGEPRLGRVVSAVVQEDPHEVTLTISFKAAGQEVQQAEPPDDGAVPTASQPEKLSSVTEGAAAGGGATGSRRSRGARTPDGTSKPPVQNLRLLEELGPGPRRGQVALVQQLLDQGADPTCCGDDGRHVLAVAVGNGHHDVIPVLVQRGADVNQRSGRMKSSALHEAAALGCNGLLSAQVLLRCKASIRCRNAGGHTPYDVALTSGSDQMVSLLAGQAGRGLLGLVGGANTKQDVN
ncbi:double zinc ribbon and ankyrin repeat-containing protein 1 isoform X2 [Antennarius striatus]|uniref:double zinc ribbon and ankyrin repeat-containing protein 1 isoform X2 n=1 Tax=Antennarius striatus TaxID=241820 RepID=UPI0035B0892E